MKQLALQLPRWGGARKGAGRKRTRAAPELGDKPGVRHAPRPRVAPYCPVHVSLRMRTGVGNLREHRRTRVLESAFRVARERFGMRIVHWSIQGNHLHLIVEVQSTAALARGMQALGIRVARRLNALAGRTGAVFVDRYYAHVLRTPREVRHAVRYVLCNVFLHAGITGAQPRWPDIDWKSSLWWIDAPHELAPRVPPRTWLLRVHEGLSGP